MHADQQTGKALFNTLCFIAVPVEFNLTAEPTTHYLKPACRHMAKSQLIIECGLQVIVLIPLGVKGGLDHISVVALSTAINHNLCKWVRQLCSKVQK